MRILWLSQSVSDEIETYMDIHFSGGFGWNSPRAYARDSISNAHIIVFAHVKHNEESEVNFQNKFKSKETEKIRENGMFTAIIPIQNEFVAEHTKHGLSWEIDEKNPNIIFIIIYIGFSSRTKARNKREKNLSDE